RLLEWTTAAQAASQLRASEGRILLQLAASLIFALTIWALLALTHSGVAPLASSFLLLWALSPLIAQWISVSPRTAVHLPISETTSRELRLVARRDWRFFETFITAADHMLPPDNFQEEPRAVVARRTSPTNIGLYLLSIVAAHDFGWLGTVDAVERLEATFKTLNAMERFRGHFYNWYATEDLRPLYPRYISTVDSGNLAGHLIVLKHACAEMTRFPTAPAVRLSGIKDTLDLALETLTGLTERLQKPTLSL